ncbi:MAG: hypothetical protein JW828_04535 [Sedimentisphaerales bacterium]|nr:hypothetical protein [Sedimentisphaerales bacterium]
MRFAILIVLVAFWRIRWCRLLLLLWLLWLGCVYAFAMGARTKLVLTYLAVVLLYHRYVRSFSVSLLATGAILLLTGFFAMSVLRGHEDLRVSLGIFSQWLSESGWRAAFSFGTEFQNGFAGAYDLFRLKQAGMIEHIPWQIQAADLLLLIPSQLLPFGKVDPQQWYCEITDVYGYFMLNPVGQAILGLDWLELVLRGAALGWILAQLHNWYSRNSNRFFVVWAYLWLAVFSYYSIRSTTFGFLYIILYRIVPCFSLVGIVAHVFLHRPITLAGRPGLLCCSSVPDVENQ